MKNENKDTYGELVMGFSALSYPPTHEQGWIVLKEALKLSSANEDHARRIRDGWSFGHSECPKPAELIEFAATIPANPKALGDLPKSCPQCAPFSGIWRLRTFRNGTEGMERCDCPRGKSLAAQDRAKDKSEEQKQGKRKSKLEAVGKPAPLSNVVQEIAPENEGKREDLF